MLCGAGAIMSAAPGVLGSGSRSLGQDFGVASASEALPPVPQAVGTGKQKGSLWGWDRAELGLVFKTRPASARIL